jgi:methyl-accepting chemotaxis protein
MEGKMKKERKKERKERKWSLRVLILVLLLIFSLIPISIVGSITYNRSMHHLKAAGLRELRDGMDHAIDICTMYYDQVQEKIIPKKVAWEKATDLICGPVVDETSGERDITLGISIGERGYIFATDKKGIAFVHPSYPWKEQKNISDLPVVAGAVAKVANGANEGEITYWFEGEEWIGTFAHFEGWDWIVYAVAPLEEFTAPAGELIIPIIGSIIMVVVIVLLIVFYMSRRIAEPFAELSKTSNKIAKGDLSARIDVKSSIREFGEVSEDINRMVDSLWGNIEELKKAIGSYNKVLNEVALGKLTARVDTEQLKGEYRLLGETFNSIISIMEFNTDELKKKEAELGEALTLYGYALEKLVDEGNLSARIDTDKLKGKHKLIGTDINLLIGGLQTKIEESKKREKELKYVISALNKTLTKAEKGDLTTRVDTKGWDKELKKIGRAINTLIESLECEKQKK